MSDLYFAGVDLGGTSIKLGIGDGQGELLATRSIPTDAHEGPDKVIQRITDGILELSGEVGKPLAAVGLGAPGLIDVPSGTTKFLPNLPTQWVDVPLGRILSERLCCPVMVANDARTATLGELKFGWGKERDNLTLAFFTLGTGVGGGVAIDGKLRLGELGAAGELGHQTIDPNGLRCGCGNRGCLETLVSAPAITGEAVRLMRSGQAPLLHEACQGDVQNLNIEAMMQVIENEKSVREVIVRAAKYLGVAVANVVTTIHPDLIVLGGGVAEIGELLTKTIKEEITWRVGMFPTENVEVKKSQLGVNAGILGALGLAMLAHENKPT